MERELALIALLALHHLSFTNPVRFCLLTVNNRAYISIHRDNFKENVARFVLSSV
jgi:hypothetical protein